ncbi:type II/IV secretion system protein [Patescibacteria group bacterium]|nr:type II/IV secretion system protein [Patescibacteria group bacterium]
MLLDELLKEKLITKEEHSKYLAELQSSNKSEEKIILENELVTEDKLSEIKGKLLNVPVFENAGFAQISNDVLALIPEESAKYYKIAPLRLVEDTFEVGMVNPEDIKAKEVILFLARQSNFKTKIYLISENDFQEVLRKYRDIAEVVGEALSELREDEKSEMIVLDDDESTDVSAILEDQAPVIKMVSAILRHGIEEKASDVHIEPVENEVRVRVRVDGILYDTLKIPLGIHGAIVARIKILSRLRIDEARMPQDGRFSTKIGGKQIDFRVSTFPTKLGEKIAIRILDPSEGLKTYKEIGLSENNLEILRKQIRKPYGMILSTGPTGSGKTTTLYAILQEINKPGVNIITLEDPIEYFVPGINQSQIRPEIGYTFTKGLRTVVRQDPDIIMVGEIRDEESANLATHAALTGHIVLSTVHTNNAIGTLARLIDLKIRPFLIPTSLNISIGQRLARRLCPFCVEKVKPLPKIEKLITSELSTIKKNVRDKLKLPSKIYTYKSKGCPKCNNKGEKGRIGIFEILRMTKDLEKIIIENPTEAAFLTEAINQGMITMRQDAIIKALEGRVSIEEVLRVTEEQA